jgi:hypothetical protein
MAAHRVSAHNCVVKLANIWSRSVDSLALNELGFHLFTRYAVMLSDEDILDALTLGDVLDVLTAEIAAES